MTDQQLELELRVSFRADVPVLEPAPAALRTSVAAIPRTVAPPFVIVARGRARLLAAAAALAATLIGLLLLGPGRPRPTPSPTPSDPTSTNTSVVEPSVAPTASPFDAGGLMVVYQVDGSTAHVFTLDPATQARREVVSLSYEPTDVQRGYSMLVRWLSDRRTVALFSTLDQPIVGDEIDAATGARKQPAALIQSLSPDGTLGAQTGDDIVIFDLQGQVVRHLPRPPTQFPSDLGPWSPDGTSIAVSGCQPCNIAGKGPDSTNRVHLYLLPVDGSPARVVGDVAIDGGFNKDLAWSPDGGTIAATLAGIVLVDVATGRLTRLTSNRNDVQPTWSDDGRRITFVRGFGSGIGLWVMDADGTSLARLTTAPAEPGDHWSEDGVPVWSPDGSTILFTRRIAGTTFGDVWQVPSAGGTPQRLLVNAVADW
jgi:dipeptidyl aminopeptidase/acylaminoacyl peptidase